jgi:Protein of unknown function (DUF1553)/Protein of unknown function (DUF1549)/Planctomycete cytochrome C
MHCSKLSLRENEFMLRLLSMVCLVIVAHCVLSFPTCAEPPAASSTSTEFSAEQLEFFESKVRPLLVERCYECHSEKTKVPKGGLRVDSRAWLLKGGDSGPTVDEKNLAKSLFIDVINYGESFQMPPKSKMKPDEIAALTKWIEMGAPWPASENKETKTEKIDIAARKQAHWCWQPLSQPTLPVVKNGAWVRDPLDQFILQKWEAGAFAPANTAEKRVLLRRLYFDLVGLPPTPEQMQAFIADASPTAVEKVVDSLLASPRFAEHWARHWLDLMRYAESRGHEFDFYVANPYHYRDYVIRALEQDLPYDQFLVEQIAGDLLPQPRTTGEQGANESILGTGFWYLGEWVHSPVDIRKDEADRYDNMVDVFSKSFLGLTVACARCHDHKFDAITQQDYYALFGYLQSTAYRQVRFDTMLAEQRQARVLSLLNREHATDIAEGTAALLRPAVESLPRYLSAAQTVFEKHESWKSIAPNKEQKVELPAEFKTTIAKVSQERQLAEPQLTAWVQHLILAEKNPQDFFHTWAKLIGQPEPAKMRAELARLEKQQTEKYSAFQQWQTDVATSTTTRVEFDFGTASPENWLQNGVSFGLSPTTAGTFLFQNDRQHPIRDVATLPGAYRDLTWKALKPAGGVDQDVGRLGAFDRAGKTIRTPTFTVREGILYYLVQGAGVAYAAVDSHSVVQGPLHGQIIVDFPADRSSSFRWVRQDLSAYKGHRVHIEFSPQGEQDLQIAQVVQSVNAPPSPLDPAAQAIAITLDDKTENVIEVVKDRYQTALQTALQHCAEGKLASEANSSAIMSWLLTHSELVPPAPSLDHAGWNAYLSEREKIVSAIQPESRYAMAMWEGSAENETLMIRGNPRLLGATIPRRLPEALVGSESAATAGSGRLEMARQLVNPKISPFTPRVMVNRVWHHLFGRGLVPSVDNFGVLGDVPTHPELLDHLSQRFVQDGWSLKKMIRTIVLSHTYQMSSSLSAAAEEERDPKNLLWRHANVRRLPAEAIRDSLLAISGRLNEERFGRSVPVQLTDFLQGRGRPQSGPIDGNGRRSIYLSTRRNFLSPFLTAFDAPIPFSSMGKRNVSNVPAQALILMNDPFVRQQAEIWAKRLLSQSPANEAERIAAMYAEAFGRAPSEQEVADGRAFLAAQREQYNIPNDKINELLPWADYAHVLFNVKEFIFLN